MIRIPAGLQAGLLVFLFLIMPLVSFACGADSFIPDEFEGRCQNLLASCRQTFLSDKMNQPDLAKRQGALINEWVDFYIDHGQEPLPSFRGIATVSWRLILKNIGKIIHQGTSSEGNWNDLEEATLPLTIMAELPFREEANKFRHPWLEESWPEESQNPFEVDRWLRARIIPSLKFLGSLLRRRFPKQSRRTQLFMKQLGRIWMTVVSQPTEEQRKMALEVTRSHLFAALFSERDYWQQMLLWYIPKE